MPDVGGLLDFSVSGLISSFIFGVIGLYLFKEGRKRTNFHVLIIGIVLMVYPYFTHGLLQDWGVGVVLCYAAYHFWDRV